MKIIGTCKNCQRPLVKGSDSFPHPVHRLEDFDLNKPIDCFRPEPEEQTNVTRTDTATKKASND